MGIASCLGNISVNHKDELVIHPHLVVAEAFWGHVMKGCSVGATAELVIIEAEGVKLHMFDEETNPNLWKST